MANSIIPKSLASELTLADTTATWISNFTVYHNRVAKYGRMVVLWWNVKANQAVAERTPIATLPYSAKGWTLIWLPSDASAVTRGYIQNGSKTMYCENPIAANATLSAFAVYFTDD